jgi:hypothetical protein
MFQGVVTLAHAAMIVHHLLVKMLAMAKPQVQQLLPIVNGSPMVTLTQLANAETKVFGTKLSRPFPEKILP